MAVYLDDAAFATDAPNLGLVLEAARQQLEPAGRMVVEVQVDGTALTGEDLNRAQAKAVGGEEVRLYSADPRQLAVETLEGVRGRLEDARVLQSEVADLLQQDEAVTALQKLGQLIEIWLQTQQAVLHTTVLVGVSLETIEVDGQPSTAITNELIAKLTQLKELVTANDTVALADVLAYEWEPVVEQWDQLLAALITRIRQGDAAADAPG